MRVHQVLSSGVVLLLVSLFCIHCGPAKVDVAKVRDAIEAENAKFVAAVKQGDAAGLAALYTEDGKLLPPNNDFVTGRQAIQDFWQGGLDLGIKAVKLEVLEVEAMGNIACEVGTYVVFAEGDQQLDNGKYIVVWKQVEGQWKLHRDIWNSSVPLPLPPPTEE